MPARIPAVAFAATLLGAACGAGEGGTPTVDPVATTVVEMPRHYRFAPVAIRVPAGSTVTWRNSDDFTHTVRFESGDRTVYTVPPGDSVRVTFEEPGEYPYVCTLHLHQMRGVVVVDR